MCLLIEITLSGNKTICRVTTNHNMPAVKYLGVFFDPNLNFKHHITSLKNKLSKALYALRTVKNTLNKKSLLLIYNSIFHCHLLYAIQIWSCSKSGPINELFKLQKKQSELYQDLLITRTLNPSLKNSKFFLCLTLLSLLNYNSCRDSLRTFCLNLLMIPGSVMPFEI